MRELLSSSETLISSDSLKILTAIFQQFPEKMEQEYMSAKELQEHKLGRLASTKVSHDQNNLIDFVFTVMLNNDRSMRNDIKVLAQNIDNSYSAIAELDQKVDKIAEKDPTVKISDIESKHTSHHTEKPAPTLTPEQIETIKSQLLEQLSKENNVPAIIESCKRDNETMK